MEFYDIRYARGKEYTTFPIFTSAFLIMRRTLTGVLVAAPERVLLIFVRMSPTAQQKLTCGMGSYGEVACVRKGKRKSARARKPPLTHENV